ncbi:4Fe-4S single cluster domain-containing protein [Neobacillus sp. PS3-34]|uniref:4Fe-4S single cluster domain-containing protein n=1 Tax=Neobacillus sp. PS3-34 TaxID=3070678 RepID=UPI0027E17D61|nr:4Fe-4S single cluster domain-containing protein [Neobacillus sp. PS3-34]WML49147.1 4Fe-4S single cluster domain-containing protein [Neobacillus sp. PS3-34]
MPYLNVAHYNDCTEAEGPGKRFALWVQGCLKRCPGCCNPQMLEVKPAKIYDCEEVFEMIQKAKREEEIEGVTFLGGEPFLQANGLSFLSRRCKEIGITVMVFSGYTVKELKKIQLPFSSEFLAEIDILVDGPFIEELYDEDRNWVGSTNQEFHYLTEQYREGIEYEDSTNKLELNIDQGNNLIHINGWPFTIE